MNLNWKWFGSCIGMIRSSVLIMLINCDFLFFMFETEKKNDNSSISTNL